MAYTVSQLQNMGYGGYAGWNDTEANADFMATGGSGKKTGSSAPSSGSGMTSTNPSDVINAAIEAYQKANAPAVASLQASIPETQATYAQTKSQLEASKPTIDQQYQVLLDQIKGNKTTDVNAQTKATNATLAARGLSTQDAGAQQDLTGALQPINTTYSNLENQTGLAKTQSKQAIDTQIANLTPQETADVRAIQNAIAQLSSGAGNNGVNTGLNLYSTNLASQTASEKAKADAAQQAIDNAIKQAQLVNQTKQTNYDINKPYSTDSGGMDLSSILSLLNGGNTTTSTSSTPTETKPTYSLGAVSGKSPGGQWAWDYASGNWYPVTN